MMAERSNERNFVWTNEWKFSRNFEPDNNFELPV